MATSEKKRAIYIYIAILGSCLSSIEFEFIPTIMGKEFLVPIKPITRLVLKANLIKLANTSFEFAD
jgi:hypothetical protein